MAAHVYLSQAAGKAGEAAAAAVAAAEGEEAAAGATGLAGGCCMDFCKGPGQVCMWGRSRGPYPAAVPEQLSTLLGSAVLPYIGYDREGLSAEHGVM